MEGSLRVESTAGCGSQFHFYLPLLAAAGPPLSTPPTPEITSLPSSFRALIVDDNAVNLRIGVHFLRKTGAHVESARDAATAIALHKAYPFDLILMDCHMPEIDGWQATEKIRALPGSAGQTPILALTADVFPRSGSGALFAA